MDFAWDPEKDARNVRERGIGFRVAIRVFDGPGLEDWDDREDYGEDRYRVIGMIDGRVVVVVYALEEDGTVGIISARKGTHDEAKRLGEYLTGS